MSDDGQENVTGLERRTTDDGGRASHGRPVRHPSSDILIATACGVFVAFMVGMAYASVPLYSWFCRATGFGGVPQVASVAPAQMLERKINVRFDANVGPGLPWRFEPERASIEARLGEVVTVFYKVTNLSDQEITGQAAYNVAPPTAGTYFTKINCFCFTEQRLAPREKREMAVVFYVDPVLVQDSEQDDLNTITLSYTFFPLRLPPPALGARASRPHPEEAGGTPALPGNVGADGAATAGTERKI